MLINDEIFAKRNILKNFPKLLFLIDYLNSGGYSAQFVVHHLQILYSSLSYSSFSFNLCGSNLNLMESDMTEENNKELLVLWASGEPETARHMVFMYTLNAKLQEWWDEVTLLVWGASGRLMIEDDYLKTVLKKMQKTGIKTIACRSCAEKMEVAEQLKELDIKVFYTGQFLTDWLQSGKKMITI